MKKLNLVSLVVTTFLLYSCGKKTAETKPIRKDVTETVFASGVLEAKNTYTLTAQADGYLSKVNFSEGDLISPGKVLAVVDNKESGFNSQSAADLYVIARTNTSSAAPVLAQAQNAIDLNRQKMDQDFLQYQRYKKLWESNSVSRIDYENAALQYNTSKTTYESSRENYLQLKQQADQQLISSKAQKNINNVLLSNNQIKALASGKVYKKYKQTGDYVKRGEAIALIGESENIYGKVSVDETNIARIREGQEVLIQLNTDRNKTYKGTVAEIYPAFDEATQSFICKLFFTDTLDFRITGTQLQCNIIVGVQKNALLIPRNYLDFGGNVQVKGKKEPVKVVAKFVSNNWVQVLSGIDENTILVTENIAANKMTTSEVGSQMR